MTAKQADLWHIIYETVSVTNCHKDLWFKHLNRDCVRE